MLFQKKPTVSVYYEALCYDSQQFYTKQFYPTYIKLGEYFNVDLLPYGKATVCHWLKNYYNNQVKIDQKILEKVQKLAPGWIYERSKVTKSRTFQMNISQIKQPKIRHHTTNNILILRKKNRPIGPQVLSFWKYLKFNWNDKFGNHYGRLNF